MGWVHFRRATGTRKRADRARHSSSAEFTDREEATRTGECLLLVPAAAGDRAGFGMLGRPVFGRKRHPPESRARRGKLQAYFALAATHWPEKRDMTLLFLFRLHMPHLDDAAAGDACLKQHQCAVGVNSESRCEFLEVLALSVRATKT